MKGFEITTTKNGKDINIFKLVYDAEVVKNLICQRCQIIRGELAYNTVMGVTLKSHKDVLDLDISSIILNTPGVKEITSFISKMNGRDYTATVSVLTTSGDELEVVL